MLKATPELIYDLYRDAIRARDKTLSSLDHSVQRLVGPAWDAEEYDGEADNPEFETIAQTSPRIVWDNPRVKCSTVRVGPPEKVAEAIQEGLNRLIVTTKLKAEAERVSVDFLLRYGVMMVVHEAAPSGWSAPYGMDMVPRRPKAKRVSVRRYFEDPLATCKDEIRFRGHETIADWNDLVERAKENPDEQWNTEVLDLVGEDASLERVWRPERGPHAPKRGEIAYFEMYLDGYQIEGQPGPDEGFNGAVFTMALGGGDEKTAMQMNYLREPYMLYCPPGGPYVRFGEYIVPDSETPLAGIVAAMAVLEERSRHGNALKRAAARRKQIGLADGLDATTSVAVQNANDGDFLVAPGFESAKAMQLELGGVTETAMVYKQYLDQKADRMLGANDAVIGNVTGVGTATENTIAAESASTRIGYVKRRFMDGMEEVLWIMAWYMYHDERVVFSLPREQQSPMPMIPGLQMGTSGPVATSMTEPWFMGGAPAPGSGYTFNDLEMRIEPYSMERTSEATLQAQGAFMAQVFPQVMNFLLQHPEVDAMAYLKLIGDSFNLPTLQGIVNPQILAALQGLGMQMSMQQPQPTMSGNENVQGTGRGNSRFGGGGGSFGGGRIPPSRTGTARIGMNSAGPAKKESPTGALKKGAMK